MAEEFSTEGMLDMYLFENEQLLEQLQEMVLEQRKRAVLRKMERPMRVGQKPAKENRRIRSRNGTSHGVRLQSSWRGI